MPRRIDRTGLEMIKRFEGCRLGAYQDSAGVWTIGFGSTHRVRPGLRITQAEAEQRLDEDLAPAEDAVDRLVTVPLTDGQFAALVSFVFNVGAGDFARSTLLKRLNHGEYDAVPAELQKFRFAGGRALPGLAARRAAEAGLWAKESYVSTNTAASQEKPLGLLTPETAVAALGTLSALGSAAATPGPLQDALVFVIVTVVIGLAAFSYRRFRQV